MGKRIILSSVLCLAAVCFCSFIYYKYIFSTPERNLVREITSNNEHIVQKKYQKYASQAVKNISSGDPLSDYIYVGVLFSSQQKVYIKNIKYGTGAWYIEGDIINGCRLEKITNQKLFFVQGADRYVLELSGDETISDGNTSIITVVSENKRVVHEEALARQISSLSQLASKIIFMPHVDNGKIDGLSVVHLAEEELAEKSGIEKGDIIKTVNGIPVTDFEDLKRAYEDVSERGVCEIRLLRDDQERSLFYTSAP